VYYGFIRVAEGAQKTDAYQKNRNLLLSEKARSDAIPNLEILANDVKCSHGASVGQVGADELFYLMSRGINRTDAEQILVQAFFEDVVAKVENPFAREYVDQVVGAAFGARAEKWRRVRPT
jgi:Fe-S cluster assembly protein SufD